MHPHSAKQDALNAIHRLPDEVTLGEIVYRLHVLNKARQGMQDIEAGRLTSSEALAKDIEQWLHPL